MKMNTKKEITPHEGTVRSHFQKGKATHCITLHYIRSIMRRNEPNHQTKVRK